MDVEKDLFEAQVEAVAQKLVVQKLQDPQCLQAILKQVLEDSTAKDQEIAAYKPKAERYDEWLDSEGFFDCARVAEKLRVPYVTPGGKTEPMGEKKFCQALAHLGIMIKRHDGYRIAKTWYKYAKEVSKLDSMDRNHWSVKFSPAAVDKLCALFESMPGVWESTGISGVVYHE